MTKKRTWKISWFVWGNGTGKADVKSVLKTVKTSNYPDREFERMEVKEKTRKEHKLHWAKMLIVKEVTQWLNLLKTMVFMF